LSKAAFNALLKTLEEPPTDVTFIFATTETEKIPVTVLSRCQHFSLQRVSLELIAKHLIQVSKLEGYELDFEASKLIAQCSEGSMRDALSILENVFAKGEKINISIVREVLGISDLSAVIMLFENLCKGDVNLSIDCFEKLYRQGVSIDKLAKSLMNLAYNLSLVKSGIKNTGEFFDEQSSKKLEEISKNFEMDFIIRFWELMQKYVNELTDVFNEKQCFEMIIMRLCYASLLPTPFEIIKKTSDNNSLKKNVEILEEKVCVVEDIGDLWAIEKSRAYNGRYHVLGGVLSAIDGIGPNDLNLISLFQRVKNGEVGELILATNATMEGQITAQFIADSCKDDKLKITRLAQGMPIGGELDTLDYNTLSTAFDSRSEMKANH
ncbi:toprim domain-containing protein, partial [Alphaproteobacteria bacterium]|nr:toprim domain-containing protein [Alphaproteobacteria bacterium]